MHTGLMDKRITILSRQVVDDGLSKKETYAPLKSVWAKVSYISDGERIQAAIAQRQISIRFVIRHSKSLSLNNEYRIRYDGRDMDIENVKITDDRQFVEITCGARK